LYGLTPPTHIPYFPEDYMVEADDNYLTTREEMSRPNLQSAQHMMVHVENQKRSERTFETFISNCNHIDKKKTIAHKIS